MKASSEKFRLIDSHGGNNEQLEHTVTQPYYYHQLFCPRSRRFMQVCPLFLAWSITPKLPPSTALGSNICMAFWHIGHSFLIFPPHPTRDHIFIIPPGACGNDARRGTAILAVCVCVCVRARLRPRVCVLNNVFILL